MLLRFEKNRAGEIPYIMNEFERQQYWPEGQLCPLRMPQLGGSHISSHMGYSTVMAVDFPNEQ